MFHKPWIFSLLAATGIPAAPQALEESLNLPRRMDGIFHWRCMFAWSSYLVANQTEMKAELDWALSRADVKTRHEQGGVMSTRMSRAHPPTH